MWMWRRMAVYETIGGERYMLMREVESMVVLADGCLDSQVEDCWLWS